MRKALSTIVQYIVFLGLGIGVIYHMLHQLTAAELKELIVAINGVNLWYLLPIFIIGFLSHFLRGLRWRYLLDTLDMHPTIMNTTLAVFIGYITNLALPRAGEVAKCTALAKYEKLPAHKMVGTIVGERAFDIFCLMLVGLLTLLFQISTISAYLTDKVSRLWTDIKSNKVVISIIIISVITAFIVLIKVYRKHRETKFGKFIKEMSHGVFSIFRMRNRGQFLAYTFLMWLMYVLQVYVGFLALPSTSHLSILAALAVLCYGAVGLIVTPGGIGLYTLLVAQILVVYGVSDIQAQAFGWIAWAVQTIIIIIFGVISLLFIHPYNKKRNAQTTVDRKQDI